MSQLDDLRPVEKRRVLDLVNEAGLDVSDWANFSRGSKYAASNPKYCYEWAFIEPGRVVILNLWHAKLYERRGVITWSDNVREWIRRHPGPGPMAIWRKRAEVVDGAIQEAYKKALPIRTIINDGKMRKATDPYTQRTSVQRRLLDPLPWAVSKYDKQTGQCTLTRGELIKGSVDQFDVSPDGNETPAERISIQSTGFKRDALLRAAALRRANGLCEFCSSPGFTRSDGTVFLETHHVVPLSEGGSDSADNLVAICPNHHREAHLGSGAEVIRETLLKWLKRKT